MQRTDRVRLRHMLDAAREAIHFAAGGSRADLEANRMLALSLVKEIEIIGEAANSISQPFRTAHPEIAWEDIIGMRHRLIHAYFDVNLSVVWSTVTQDLPPLVDALEALLRSETAR